MKTFSEINGGMQLPVCLAESLLQGVLQRRIRYCFLPAFLFWLLPNVHSRSTGGDATGALGKRRKAPCCSCRDSSEILARTGSGVQLKYGTERVMLQSALCSHVSFLPAPQEERKRLFPPAPILCHDNLKDCLDVFLPSVVQ